LLARFISANLGEISGWKVLDLGAGPGEISSGLAAAATDVFSVDLKLAALQSIRLAVSKTGRAGPVAIRAVAEALPFADGTFNLVILNGVLEWIGSTSPSPIQTQRRALKEIRRVLREDGILYLATENRLFPAHLAIDPHTHQLLVNALPRPVARAIGKLTRGKPFGNYIYTYWGLTSLVREEFSRVTVFAPLPHYHHPYLCYPLDSSKKIREGGLGLLQARGLGLKYRLLVAYAMIVASLRLNRPFLPYFVLLGEASRPEQATGANLSAN